MDPPTEVDADVDEDRGLVLGGVDDDAGVGDVTEGAEVAAVEEAAGEVGEVDGLAMVLSVYPTRP